MLCQPCTTLDFASYRIRRVLTKGDPAGIRIPGPRELSRWRQNDQTKKDWRETAAMYTRWKERQLESRPRDWPFDPKCDLCTMITQRMQRYDVGTNEKLAVDMRQSFGTEDDEHCSMSMRIFVEAGLHNFCGPLQPHEEAFHERKEKRVILELQECSDPIPTTADGLLPVGQQSARSIETELSGRLLNSQADLCLFSHWIDRCRKLHGESCSSSIMPANHPRRLEGLLLINVVRACITPAPDDCRYVALSYCWGTTPTLKHVLQNSEELRRDRALTNVTAPATIRDAMTLVCGLGERYLWVDALCIVQDDPLSKQTQLSQMGLVYTQAAFTIVAAGTDANAGLPGVRVNTRTIDQQVLRIDGKAFASVIDHSDYYGGARDSPWETRAWTFQEKILSKRLLIFTDAQVYWSCWNAVWREEVALENASNLVIRKDPLASTGSYDRTFSSLSSGELRNICSVYTNLVNIYLKRHLSFQSDILNAFSGLCEVLGALGNDSFHWGLPVSFFEEALCWRLNSGGTRNHALSDPIAVPFPSWSWVAWHGSSPNTWIIWETASKDWRLESPDIRFYCHNLEDEFKSIRNFYQIADFSEEEERLNDHVEVDLAAVRGQWKHKPSKVQRSHIHSQVNAGQLHFWTSKCTLYVGRQPSTSSHSGYNYFLVYFLSDDPYTSVHAVFLDTPEHLNFIEVELMSAIPEAVIAPLDDLERWCEVVAIDFLVIKTIDDKVFSLAVEWKDGIAYRVGILTLNERLWAQLPNREWKQVVLA